MQPTQPPPGVGTITVRLADIPLQTRMEALNDALELAKTDGQAAEIIHLVLDPGSKGGRIAA